jgi:uncharacterized protein (DUF58 family)
VARYALAALLPYASLALALQRSAGRVYVLYEVSGGEVVTVEGEVVELSLRLSSWLLALSRVSSLSIHGDCGLRVSSFRVRREGLSAIAVDALLEALAGTHVVRGVTVKLRLLPVPLVASVTVPAATTVRVVPRVGSRVAVARGGAPYDIGLRSIGRPGTGTTFYGTREYRPGDELRYVDWKASSRLGRLVVKLFEREVFRCVALVVALNYGFFRGARPPLPRLFEGVLDLAAELLRYGAEVLVAVVYPGRVAGLTYVKLRRAEDLANLAEALSRVEWPPEVSGESLAYRTALWLSLKLATELLPGRCTVAYVGEPESDVDLVASRLVANSLRNLGYRPVFALTSAEVVKLLYGEAGEEDLVALARRFSRVYREVGDLGIFTVVEDVGGLARYLNL